MRVSLNINTRYKGKGLKPGDILDVSDEVGKRWCSVGLAELIPTDSDEGDIEEDDNDELSDLRNEDTTSNLPRGTGDKSSGEQRKAPKDSKRHGKSGNNGKNRPK